MRRLREDVHKGLKVFVFVWICEFVAVLFWVLLFCNLEVVSCYDLFLISICNLRSCFNSCF